ncbi:MAG: ComEC/Rec2 family competence protein [Patescibacteria group bacterium]
MRSWKYILATLALAALSVWLGVFGSKDKNLHLIACDVGQGDAILVSLGNQQILTDAGPDNSVLDCLAKYLPFWDREIEVVILTHPQLDHYGGLVEVLNRYKVDTLLVRDFEISTSNLQALKKAIGGSQARLIKPVKGLVIRLGMIYLDILHPSEEFQSSEINEESVVYRLRKGDFEALLTGDIGKEATEKMLQEGLLTDVDYIKIPHHGSRNGLTLELLKAANPEVVVISAGKNNAYGHPHQEVLKMLKDRDIKILRTDQMGNIEIVSDGKSFWQGSD